jgi:capsular polysaccharide biosynthesis protein
MSASWRIEDPGSASGAPAAPSLLVSLHFMMAALRRRWRTCAVLATVGALMGLAAIFLLPTSSVGTVTIRLAHAEGADPSAAMSTDVSLLRTRIVAQTVVDDLDLGVKPTAFQQSVIATPVTPEILVLEARAASDAQAKETVAKLAETFLDFRTQQMLGSVKSTTDGYRDRVTTLQQRVDSLSAEYDRLSAGSPAAQSEAAVVLTERSKLNSEISSLQETIEGEELQTNAVVSASHVLDPASLEPSSLKKRVVLSVGSGLIGGLAIGVGVVLIGALTTDRLRRREEVALALGVPVRLSVGKLHERRWTPRRGHDRARDLALVVSVLESAIPIEEKPARLVVATVGDATDGELAVGSLGAAVAAGGASILLVDLAQPGNLGGHLDRALDRAESPIETPTLLRPSVLPQLAEAPYGVPGGTAGLVPADDPRRKAWDDADVVVVLAEIDPALDLEHLATWSNSVVLLVRAGQSSAERLRTAAELIRSAGMELLFAVLIGSDSTDESLGLPDRADVESPSEMRRTAP